MVLDRWAHRHNNREYDQHMARCERITDLLRNQARGADGHKKLRGSKKELGESTNKPQTNSKER